VPVGFNIDDLIREYGGFSSGDLTKRSIDVLSDELTTIISGWYVSRSLDGLLELETANG
jgi:hypothetical protein